MNDRTGVRVACIGIIAAGEGFFEYPSLASPAQGKLVHFAEYILSEAKVSVQAAR